MKNPVAKNMNKFNKSKVFIDKKKKTRNNKRKRKHKKVSLDED